MIGPAMALSGPKIRSKSVRVEVFGGGRGQRASLAGMAL